MSHWQWAVLLKPAAILAYAALIALLVSAAASLPDGPMKQFIAFRFPKTKATGILMMLLAIALIAVPIIVAASFELI